MPEEVTFLPGNSANSASYTSDPLVSIDDRLANDESGYIVDTDGNRIILGGGFSIGDNGSTSTWQPGDNI